MIAEEKISRTELILSAQPLLHAAEKALRKDEHPSELPSVWCIAALIGLGALYFGCMILICLNGALEGRS